MTTSVDIFDFPKEPPNVSQQGSAKLQVFLVGSSRHLHEEVWQLIRIYWCRIGVHWCGVDLTSSVSNQGTDNATKLKRIFLWQRWPNCVSRLRSGTSLDLVLTSSMHRGSTSVVLNPNPVRNRATASRTFPGQARH